MPAIGARTTGDSMTWRPMRSGGSTGDDVAAGAGGAGVGGAEAVTADMTPSIVAEEAPGA